MMYFKKLIAVFVVFTGLITITGCSQSDEVNGGTPKISFGMMSSIDAIPMIIAEEQGFFDKYNVEVDLQAFKNSKERDAAFQGGILDGIISDLIAIGLYNEANFDVKITGSTTGSFELLANPAIEAIGDLKGKKVIISKNTSIEYTLDKALESAGLTEKEIVKEEVPAIPTRLELLKNNQSAAAVLPEPFVTMGVSAGLKTITSTTELKIDPFITAFTQEAIDKKGKAIQAFYKAYDEAVEYLNSHEKEEYIDIVIEKIGYPEELKQQIELPTFRKNSIATDEDINSAFDWLRGKKLLTKDLQPKDVVSTIANQ